MDLKGRTVDKLGVVSFSRDGLVDHLMRGGELKGLHASSDPKIEEFNALCRELDHPEDQIPSYSTPDLTVEEWDKMHISNWFTPEPFASLDVLNWLYEKCEREEEIERVMAEWPLFQERDMEPVLRHLIYMIDHFRKRNVVWGVGRGSSVASYCLYLIGVHKVDSIAFGLDVTEFLK